MFEYNTAEEAEKGDFIPPRETFQTVINNIEADLEEPVSLMDPTQFNPVELNYWAARALQTKVYLYTEQYDQVIPIAEEIINSGNFQITSMGDLVSTWESGSGPESLFELAFTDTDRLGTDNISRIYRDTNYGDVEASKDLYTAHAEGDVRKELYSSDGETHRMVSKYSDELGSDNVRILRYAEVILSYEEALTQTNSGQMSAAEALNMLAEERYDGGSPYNAAVNRDEVLAERRIELAMEGHRLYDFIRTGRDIPVGDASSARTQAIEFGTYQLALPIPESEIRANSSIDQNEGY